MSSKYNTIVVERKNFNGLIWLNRPEKRNALNDEMVRELKIALNHFSNDPQIKTLVIKGRGSAFCSGADLAYLKALRENSFEDNLKDSENLSKLFYQLYTFPKPVIALVDGPALAGGCGLVSVCDFVLATEQARFGYPEVRIGFIAALVSAFLKRQVGERQAKHLLLTGTIIDAHKAQKIGLVNQVMRDSGEMEAALENLLKELSANSSYAMQASKLLFTANIQQELDALVNINARYRQSDDFIEGISAFIEKRKPKWSV